MLNSTRAALLAAAIVGGLADTHFGDASAQVPGRSEIVGIWEAENGNLKFEMFEAGGSYAARMIYGNRLVEADGKTFKKDTLNPDPKLRDRSLHGIVFLKNLKWDASDHRWDGGSIYDGSSGRSYSAQVLLVNGKMELRGYMGVPALGQTVVLRRVTP